MMQPLDGITVLDFTTLLPGPLATLMLAEAGARVIKVERPGMGDEMRGYGPFVDGQSLPFALLNRGKESLAVDLKTDEGRAVLRPYLEEADVLVEQFRPGVMARLGLGYDDVAAINPGVVYCSITGYGQTGPRAGEAGHDINYIARSGLLALATGGGEPTVPPGLMADIAGGSYPAVMNILLALRARDRDGKGQHLDIAMTEATLPFTWWAWAEWQASGRAPGDGAGALAGGSPRYALYQTSDGRLVAAGPLEDRFWVAFCEAIGLDDALRDDRRDPQATRDGVARLIAARPSTFWARAFAAADCCAVVVASLDEAMDDPHFRARDLTAHRLDIGKAEAAALPLPLSPAFRADPAKPVAAPQLGGGKVGETG